MKLNILNFFVELHAQVYTSNILLKSWVICYYGLCCSIVLVTVIHVLRFLIHLPNCFPCNLFQHGHRITILIFLYWTDKLFYPENWKFVFVCCINFAYNLFMIWLECEIIGVGASNEWWGLSKFSMWNFQGLFFISWHLCGGGVGIDYNGATGT